MKRAVFLSLAVCLALTGCSSGLTIFSNYRRLEMIELVRTVTVDTAEDGVNVSICGTAGEKQEARMYQNTGPSIGVAMNELTLMPLGRQAILSHTESMLIGEDAAKTRLDEVLDYVERFSEMRLDTGLFIVRDGTALDLVSGVAGKETPAADVVAGLTESLPKVGEGYVFSCREIAASLSENGCALIQCVRGEKEEKLFENRGDMNIKPAGFAVMLPDSTAGYLTEEETLGAMLILGKYESHNMDVPVGDAVLTVSVDLAKPKIRPVFSDSGELERIRLELELQSNLVSMDGLADLRDEELRRKVEEKLSELMGGALEKVLERERTLGLDFLDLEGICERREPIRMEDMPQRWEDIFTALPVDVSVKSVLMRTYDIIDPPEISGKAEGNPWEKLTESLRGS